MKVLVEDPLREAERIEGMVTRRRGGTLLRAYFMIGYNKPYTGKAVLAGMTGCNMRCIYCMWPPRNLKPRRVREESLLTPRQAAERIVAAAKENNLSVAKIGGGEPTIGWEHTIRLIRILEEKSSLNLVLETNGIVPAVRGDIAEDISTTRRLVVRVSIKAATPEMFQKITRVPSAYFDYPFRFMEKLVDSGVEPSRIKPVIMISFEDPRVVARLGERLAEIDYRLIRNAEPEIVLAYPDTLRRMKRYGRRLRPSPFDYPWDEEDRYMTLF